MRLAIALVMALVALPSGASAQVAAVGCANRAEPGGPPPTPREERAARRASIVLPYLTLWGVRQAASARFGPRRHTWKAGLSIRGYRAVSVRVARRDRRWISLTYVFGPAPRRVADGDPAVRFVPCPRGTKRFSDGRPLGRETGWAGGFVVARPGCATLLVRRDGVRRSTRVRIGFGVRCR